jgi:DNA-binding GntR family transcriptional regulator
MDKIPLKSLHQEVVDRIYEMIRKGELKMGQKIVENELSSLMGISRTPLREAIRALSSEGLVELKPNKGAFVVEPSVDEICDMFEAMSIFEGACTKTAVKKMTEKDLKKLEELHEQLEQHYADTDQEAYITVNNKFHTYIQEILQNNTINNLINVLRKRILLFRYRQLYLKNRFNESIKEHRDIIKSFRDRDAEAAEHLMQIHLINQCEALVNIYKKKMVRSWLDDFS